jgi:hypothetical protein
MGPDGTLVVRSDPVYGIGNVIPISLPRDRGVGKSVITDGRRRNGSLPVRMRGPQAAGLLLDGAETRQHPTLEMLKGISDPEGV